MVKENSSRDRLEHRKAVHLDAICSMTVIGNGEWFEVDSHGSCCTSNYFGSKGEVDGDRKGRHNVVCSGNKFVNILNLRRK